eukprot:SAG11_NODE_493_length_8965_cov_4.112339_5_plen_660_part_00
MQGGVVSRPGMAFTNIIGRSLGRDVLNFGYSGQGYMETSVATFLVKIEDSGAFVIDCNPNMAHVDWCGICGTQDPTGTCPCSKNAGGHGGAGPGGIRNRTIPLVRSIRSRGHPTTPIVLSEGTRYGSGWTDDWQGSYAEYNTALREQYLKLVAAGDRHIFYVFGKDLYANDTHAVDVDSPTAAGCHPTDVGHYRIARHYSTVLPRWMAGETNEANARVVRTEHEISHGAARQQHHPLNCEPLPAQCPSQEGKNATCFACAKAHASILAKDPGCTASLIRDWCLKAMSAPATTIWTKAAALGPIRGIPSFPLSLTMGSPFHRFPSAAQKDLTAEMWEMSTWGSGTYVRFDSNASALAINFTLTLPYEEYETLMDIDGTSGFDLYALDLKRSVWLFVGNCLGAFEAAHGNQTLLCHLGSANQLSPKLRNYILYLPLYNGVKQLSIGHSSNAVLKPGVETALDRAAPAILWFGTSITQGGAASRPGAQFINGIARSLGRPVINWGFAGPGQMELSVAKYIAQIQPPPAAVVIDCLPDMDAAMVTARTAPLVRYLRAHGLTSTPIVLAEGTNYTNQWLVPSAGPGVPATWQQPAKRAAFRVEYEKLVTAGDKNLHYVEGSSLLGQEKGDLESPLVMGVHPSDLGEERLRSFWVKKLPQLLGSA